MYARLRGQRAQAEGAGAQQQQQQQQQQQADGSAGVKQQGGSAGAQQRRLHRSMLPAAWPAGGPSRRSLLQQADPQVMQLLAQWITKGEGGGVGLGLGLPAGTAASSLPEGPCRNSSVLFDFVVLEGSELSWEEQLHVLTRSGVIVGVHGAALTQQLFMPPGECHSGCAAWC
jgi:hypothetical protein